VMRNASRLGCESLQFIGGEVLLVPYLRTLITDAESLGFTHLEIFTNATAMNDGWVRFCRDHPRVSVATSFYSCNPDVHDHITQTPGSWRRTVAALESLRDAEVPLRVGIIVLPHNESDVAPTTEFLRGVGVSDVGVDHVRSFGRATNLVTSTGYLRELCGQCGNKRLCITAEGDILPCIMARKTSLGNYLKGLSLERALASGALSTFRTGLRDARTPPGKTTPEFASAACSPDCWPHGGCAPHDICKPHGK